LLARASTFAPVPVAGRPQPERAILEIDSAMTTKTAQPGNESERSFSARSKRGQPLSKEAERQEKAPYLRW
jgi:hypothetical protein